MGKVVRLYFVAILCLAQAEIAYAQPMQTKASAVISLGESPDASVVKIFFDRVTSEKDALLVTSLNLSYQDAPKRVEQLKVNPINNYFSLLTGWFVVQQQGQELWVGLSLPKGENHGEITLSVPGMLSLTSGYPEIYEMNYYKPNPMLADLTASSASAVYAPMTSIKVGYPKWGEVIKKQTTGWSRIQGGYFVPDLSGKNVNVLVIQRNPTLVADWLRNSLSPFAGGLSVALIASMVLFGMRGKINNRHRHVAIGVVVLALIVLFAMAGEFPPNTRVLLFDGAQIIGFILPFLMVAILPTGRTEAIRLYFEELRNAKG